MTDTGLCARPEFDPDLWFLRKAGEQDRAKTLCGRCPLLAACSDYALSAAYPVEPEEHQIIAGMTTSELLKARGGKTHRGFRPTANGRYRLVG